MNVSTLGSQSTAECFSVSFHCVIRAQMLMNYANSLQLAYNIGDNQQLAYAALKTIRRRCSPTPTLGLMYRSGLASMQGDLITCRISMLITAASPRCTAAPRGERGGRTTLTLSPPPRIQRGGRSHELRSEPESSLCSTDPLRADWPGNGSFPPPPPVWTVSLVECWSFTL